MHSGFKRLEIAGPTQLNCFALNPGGDMVLSSAPDHFASSRPSHDAHWCICRTYVTLCGSADRCEGNG